MTPWETYRVLCGCLARCCGVAQPEISLKAADWPLLIEGSSHHVVTPTLAWCLSDREQVPADVGEYLDASLFLNAQRNTILLDHLEAVAGALNAIDVTPVLLKGAAVLVEQLYPHPGMRILGDLDLLIPRSRSKDVVECVRALGFTDPMVFTWTEGASHHLPPHVHHKTGAGLELHLEVVKPWLAKLVPAADVTARATPSLFRGTKVLIPSPTDQIAHYIVHSQIADGLHIRGIVSLRRLLDLALLCERHEAEIDWHDLIRRFRDARYKAVLERTVSLARELFQSPKIAQPIAPEDGALQILQNAIEHPNRQSWGILILVLKRHIHRLRAAPYRHLSILNPWTWPRRLATIRGIFRTPPKW